MRYQVLSLGVQLGWELSGLTIADGFNLLRLPFPHTPTYDHDLLLRPLALILGFAASLFADERS
jgi:hypothetical protein